MITSIANKKLNATFQFHDASISLIKHFPNLSIEIENSSILGNEEFSQDTLASIPQLSIEIAPLAYLFNNQIEIQDISINQAKLHLIILPNGKMNWDIYKSQPETSAAASTNKAINLGLKHYQLINSDIHYTDKMRGFSTQLLELNHEGSGNFLQDIFTLQTSTEVGKLNIEYLGKTYLSEVKSKLEAPIEMNFSKREFAFKNNDLYLNDLPVHFDAKIVMPDSSIDLDIQFKSQKSPLKNFLSLIPLLYQNSFKDLTASGDFTLSGYVKGRMTDTSMPGFGLELLVSKGAFSYAQVPVGVKQMELDLQVSNPDGVVDHTVVDLKQLQLMMNHQPLRASLLFKNPISNPYIKASLKGMLNLGEIAKIIPKKNTQMSGSLDSDIQLDGYVKEFKQAKGKASGYFKAHQIIYKNSETQQNVAIHEAAASISPKFINISKLHGTLANTRFEASGNVENYVMYFLKNEKIIGTLQLNSPLVDLNAWGISHAKAQTNSTNQSSKTIANWEIPKNINFSFRSKIDKLLLKDLVITQALGDIRIADQVVSLKNLSFDLANASWKSTGTFSKVQQHLPVVQFDFKINNLDIQEAHKYFSLVQKFAPIAAAAQGKVHVDFTYSGTLNSDLSPNLMSTQAVGNMDLINLNLKKSPSFNQMLSLTRWEQLKNLELKPTHLNFQIQQGRLQFKPFELNSNLTKFHVSGSNGLDQSLEYNILADIPAKTLTSGIATSLNQQLMKLNPKLDLANLQQALKMQLQVRGNIQKPQFKVNLVNGKQNNAPVLVASQAKELVKQEAKQQLNKQLDEAKIKADALKKEAVVLSQKIRQEAYANADRLVEEAKNPFAKIAAQKIAEKLKKEADRKADALLEEADKKAQELIEKARQN